jgi:flavin reductase (DIM6/NTAB) family NADH-FMN oxidoreductase RutF
MLKFQPPLAGCVISNCSYSFDRLVAGKTCVINIPTMALAKKFVGVGNGSGPKVDKLRKFGLKPTAASCIQPPLIEECFAKLECRVTEIKMVK